MAEIDIVGRDAPPPWPDIAEVMEAAPFAGHTRYALLQGGMSSGRTSVMIAFPLSGDRWVSVETSLAMLEAVVATAHGAEARWAEA